MLLKKEIDKVVDCIVKGYGPDRIILFGSYADGSATEYSDLDLLVVKDDNTPVVKRNRLVRSFLKEFLFQIDIIVKNNIEFDRLKNVVGTIVYAADKRGKIGLWKIILR